MSTKLNTPQRIAELERWLNENKGKFGQYQANKNLAELKRKLKYENQKP